MLLNEKFSLPYRKEYDSIIRSRVSSNAEICLKQNFYPVPSLSVLSSFTPLLWVSYAFVKSMDGRNLLFKCQFL